MNNNIRAVIQADIEPLKKVVDSSQLFPSEYLEEMIADYFHNPNTEDIWFTSIDSQVPVAIGYCIPEKLTEGTYNLLALGVLQVSQGKGIATDMLKHIEQLLKQNGGRVLIIETSSDDSQSAARQLYQKTGYTQEAVIRDFWKEGEEKTLTATA